MEDLIYRILNKKIILNVRGQEIIILAPTSEIRQKAEIYKKSLINSYRFDLPILDDYMKFLVLNRFVETNYQAKIDNMNENIRKLKVQLFNCGAKLELEKKIRKELEFNKKQLSSYVANIEYYKQQTLEYFADSIKNKYILLNTTYHNDRLLFDSNNINQGLFDEVVTAINEQDISTSKFREIARSDSWRMYWNANKYDIFGIPAKEYSEEQKILCMFSRMYQSIWDSPDCPAEEVIEDDDKTDGFLIQQHEKNKENQKNKNVSNLDPRFSEVFVAASSQESANIIYDANTNDSKRILKERSQVLTTKEEVKDIDYRDVKLDVLAQKSKTESQIIKHKSFGGH